jgi:hypothetical protein
MRSRRLIITAGVSGASDANRWSPPIKTVNSGRNGPAVYRSYFRRFCLRFRARIQRASRNLNSGLMRPSVCQALAFCTLRNQARAFKVTNAKTDAVIVTEIEFREITVQMLFGTMLIYAAHTALED